jgi:hypothetical protein
MKKLILSAAILLGSMNTFAATTALINLLQVQLVIAEEFTKSK